MIIKDERTPEQRLEALRSIFEAFRKTTPSSADWFYAIDELVTEIAAAEIKRREALVGAPEGEEAA